MDALSVLLTEQGLAEYEPELRAKGITEPHHLLRLTPAVIETLIPDKPIHQRKLAALSRGRNLNASTFSMDIETPRAAPPSMGGAAPFRSKSADDVLPEKPGLRNAAKSSPELFPDLAEAINAKFGEGFNETVVTYLKLQGVECNPDLKYVDMTVLLDTVKEAGAKPIQLGKLKDWVQTQAGVMPALAEVAPAATEPADDGKKKKPAPKRDAKRSNSSNDTLAAGESEDVMHDHMVKRFGKFYGDTIQSFLMTQGVLNEDDLMVRDDLKMLTTAKTVGVKPVQLAKLKEWMEELKDLGNGPVRPVLPHERQGSRLKLTKDKAVPSDKAKDYDAGVRASRASKDLGDGALSL